MGRPSSGKDVESPGSRKVLLVDLDSKISNLALMKLSSFHKAKGDRVALCRLRGKKNIPAEIPESPDRVYISSVFSWNLESMRKVAKEFVGPSVILGGSGYDVGRFLETHPGATIADMRPDDWTPLPLEAEVHRPDYSLYGYDYAIGFCNRGCNRKCSFCIVSSKEGTIKRHLFAHPSTWVPDGFRKAALLDNDMALYDFQQAKTVLEWGTDAGVKLSVNQGWDIRALAQDPRQAGLIAANMPWDLSFKGRRLYTAWDYPQNEGWVRKGLKLLIDAGVRPRAISCYVLAGFGTTHEQDYYRMHTLHYEFGVEPFLMVYNNRTDDPWLRALARWCNRPALRRKTRFEDYRRHPDYGARGHVPLEGW